jgi:ribonucleoside-diphosphate reductase alpha chain
MKTTARGASESATRVLASSEDNKGFTPIATARKAKKSAALKFPRRFTVAGEDPFETVEWEKRTAAITGEDGKVVFEQKDCEIPKTWSQLATNVVVSKYFRGPMGSPRRETSVRQVIGRVADTLHRWGAEGGYFASEADAQAFRDELVYLLLHQYGSFNSPVWFNIGVEGAKQQASACFINSVHDNMESIMDLAATEARLFKGGSGAGTNLWRIRSSKEHLSGGGIASGPVSFMRGWDAFAGAIKSGGTTRRAAKMVILNADHPDIEEFILCKAEEEKKAWALIEAGYNGGFNVPGGAYDSVDFQNANHSVRVTDEFMRAAENNAEWTTRAVTSGAPVEKKAARELLKKIAEATHVCGDPGLQYDTTINDWHTSANTDRIYASNPCSEFVFLDDTACNLASLNLMKFRREDGSFDAEAFVHGCETFITAQEIIVSNASYPTERIARNSEDYRPLGLGYANLGALLMAQGTAYDSDEGRALAGAITAIMTGSAYRQSAKIASNIGPFNGYEKNREPMLRVIGKHRDAVSRIHPDYVPGEVLDAAQRVWDEALLLGQKHGYRNAQATVLAPTGTIAFMMDCDTTGIEPDIALVKYKKLVGGGLLKIVNQTVPEALRRLGYSSEQAKEVVDYIDKNDTIEGAPGLKEKHLAVFDCAFKAMNGTRSIHHMGHVKMMAAAQPFISGAISKTVNVPAEATVEEIADAYLQAWKLGLKAIAIYRDGSKRTQPLSTSTDAMKAESKEARPARRKLPDERMSITHKFSIAGQEGYFTVGLYEDGSPGEIFIKMSKEGSTISGLMDSFAVAISMCLQYGVPLRVLVNKFSHSRFEPSGYTTNKDIPIAKSLMDYIFRWFDLRFHPNGDNGHLGKQEAHAAPAPAKKAEAAQSGQSTLLEADAEHLGRETDAPPCTECGTIMVRAGKCYSCPSCGTTSGCG